MDKSYIKYNTSFKVLFISVITTAIIFATLALVNKAEAKQTEEQCLTEAIYFEARGESFVGQLAVANVILQRVRDSRFPPTVCEVVHAGRYWEGHPIRNKCAFSYWCDGKPEIMKDKQALRTAQDVARMAIDGVIYEEIQGATFYHASYVSPYWTKDLEFITKIGKHLFYYYDGK